MPGHMILLNLLGGIALLVWGTSMVRTGVLRTFGTDLRRILAAATDGRSAPPRPASAPPPRCRAPPPPPCCSRPSPPAASSRSRLRSR
jgi:hypothetical protein